MVGLVNIGNSCYINTSIQILSKIEHFRNEILKFLPPKIEKNDTENNNNESNKIINENNNNENNNSHFENSSFDLLSTFSVIFDKLNTQNVVSVQDISDFKSSCGFNLSLKYYSNEQQGKQKLKIIKKIKN